MKKLTSLLVTAVTFLSISAPAFAEDSEYRDDFFTDVNRDGAYFFAVNILAMHDVVDGYPDGTFKRDNPISRAEFLKILINSTSLESEADSISTDTGFKDVPSDAWFAKYVAVAKNHNIIEGYSDKTFRPDKPVTRAEAAKILISAMEEYGNFKTNLATDVYSYTLLEGTPFNELEVKNVDPKSWYGKYVLYGHQKSILPYQMFSAPIYETNNGKEEIYTTFDAEKPLTRGEMAEIITRAASVNNSAQNFIEESVQSGF